MSSVLKKGLKTGASLAASAGSAARKAGGNAKSLLKKAGGSSSLFKKADSAGAAAKKADDVAAAAKKMDDVADAAKKMDDVADAGSSLAKAGKKASEAVQKAAGMCKKNPKMCAAGVLGAGTAAYAAKKYMDMTEEQKECASMCFPENWHEYIEGKVKTPNYKVIDGASLSDPSIKYAPLYDDIEISSQLCTPGTLAEYGISEGPDSCNVFCEAACDFAISDVVSEVVKDGTKAAAQAAKASASVGADIAGGIGGGLLEGLGIDLEAVKKNMKYAGMVLLALFLLFIASKFM